jgi:osmotically-inducible protein OsmY
MMNSNSTSKIVIGVGLLAVFGVGVSIFAIRAKQEMQVARNTSAPAVAAINQSATEATAPAQSAAVPTPADPTVVPSSAAPAALSPVGPNPIGRSSPTGSDAVNDTGGDPAGDVSKPPKSKVSDHADRRAAKARPSADMTATRVASAADFGGVDRSAASSSASSMDAAQAPSSTDATSSPPAGATADTHQAAAQSGQEAAISAASATSDTASGASDSQITADVKSQISTAAPNNTVDVTTTKGVVALAGSVPSLDAVNQARQAAQQVAGVKYVDASALMVSNQ